MTYPKRLIEVDLPIKRISAHARREKSIRQGHISTLHIWWARRPLAACRAVICAALWFDPADVDCPPQFRQAARQQMHEWARDHRALMSAESFPHFEAVQKHPSRLDDDEMLRTLLLDFIADFSNWDNSTRRAYLETSRALTHAAHIAAGGEAGTRPLVVDPFAGGGAIPLEALRVGASAFASDLNPVAVLLNKVVLEYIPRYGQGLADEVRKWGAWVKAEAEKELGEYYPKDPDGATPIGYLWARTIICEGPGCGVEVPIIKSQILSPRRGQEAAVAVSYQGRELKTRVVKGAEALPFDQGTSKRSSVTCPRCGFTTARTRVEAQANERGFGFHMLAVCVRQPDEARFYRQPTAGDLALVESTDEVLEAWASKNFGNSSAIPHEELPYLRSIFNVRVYGIDQWHKLYHRRQLVSALVFTQAVRKAAGEISSRINDKYFASAITNSLALSVSNSFQYQCNIATYLTEGIKSAFIQGQSLPMKMDFIEANPLMDDLAGGYQYSLDKHLSGLEYAASFPYPEGTAQQVSALAPALPEDSVSVLVTDPPYYDVIPYADCSDFFYVWLRRMLNGLTDFPAAADLTPKDEEIVQLAERNERYRARTKEWFEHSMRDAMSVARASVAPNGVGVVVFAHKSTAGWEAQLQAMIDAGWTVTGSWAIDTEKSSRLRANDSAVLGSSVHLVCRPRENADGSLRENDIGDWRDVLRELPVRIHQWMPRLAKEGVVGADAIFACLGPALEIFSRYSRVEKASGEEVTLREYLEYVWAAVAREALTLIFAGATDADVTGYEADARLTAMWLWTLFAGAQPEDDKQGADADADVDTNDEESSGKASKAGGFTLEYDAARKIAQGLGAHLEELTSLVEVKGDKARLLSVSERTKHLFGKDEAEAPRKSSKKKDRQAKLFETLEEVEAETGGWGDKSAPKLGETVLERVHQSMILFAAGRGEAMKRFLVDEGVGQDERFWRLANALSALYPSGGDEKRWVDGVLARKKGLGF